MKRNCLLIVVLIASSCGGEDGNGGTNGASNVSGKLVFGYVTDFGGQTDDAVHVFDVKSGHDTVFRAVDSPSDDVSVAKDGTIAQMSELDDAVAIEINKPNGDVVKQFTESQALSFATSGAIISPDATKVAFSLDVDFGNDQGRGAATFVCSIADSSQCAGVKNGKSPSWTSDGRVLVVNDDQTSIYLGDAAFKNVERLSTRDLDKADNPVMSSDGRYVVFDEGANAHLSVLDMQTATVTPLTKNGVSQFRAALSPDGKTLAFQQPCCSDGFPVPTFYLVPFRPGTTVSADYSDVQPLKDDHGAIVAVSGRAGWY